MKCPLCQTGGQTSFIERFTDPYSRRDYVLYRCLECDGDFSDPMENPSAEWYGRAYPLRMECSPGHLDYRFRWFFKRHPSGQGARLLDIGTGSGIFVGEAQAHGFDAYGIDYDARAIEWGTRRGIRHLAAGPMDAFLDSQPPESWDWITLFEVLEHVASPADLLRKSAALLRPGGRLVICVPNKNRILVGGRERHDYPPHHLSRWTPNTLRRALVSSGLSLESVEDNHLTPRYLAHNSFDVAIRSVLSVFKSSRDGRPASFSSDTRSHVSTSPTALKQSIVNFFRENFIRATWPLAWGASRMLSRRFPGSGELLLSEAKKAISD